MNGRIDLVVAAIESILEEADLDPAPPWDIGVLNLVGVRVFFTPYGGRHDATVLGEFPKPPHFDLMPPSRQIAYALLSGAVLFLHESEATYEH